ncbi:MAG: endonuclease III [Acidimicrobiia bacterium]|jgi:endonuclease III|nr:endonuclease III [Acidimicrobiia bacterium]
MMAKPRSVKGRAARVQKWLSDAYPGSARDLCALKYRNPYELLAATILSAQCTDEMVNKVTPNLFSRYPTAADLAHAKPLELEDIVHATGFFRSKAKNLMGMANALEDRFSGEVPSGLADLVSLPGVGRKTANVVRSVVFNEPGLPVDTHVSRLSNRLGLTTETDPVKIEHELNALVPPEDRGAFSLRLILHGRAVCVARKPRCRDCGLADICPAVEPA